MTSQTLSRENVIASKGVWENKVDPVTHRKCLKQPGPAWAAVAGPQRVWRAGRLQRGSFQPLPSQSFRL